MGIFDKKVKFLNIILNNKSYNRNFEELFKNFSEFYAVTFVSSPKYFFDFIEKFNFNRVKLIIGIEDTAINEKFNLLNPETQINFFKNLSSNILKKIKNNDIEIRYSNIGITIHSKIYILKSENQKRLIIGSANFTEKAMKSLNQFEELICYDNNFNPELIEIYENRFNEIWSQTIDYVPERLKKTEKPEVKLFSTDKALEILKENLHKVNIVGVSSEAIKDLIKTAEKEKQDIEYKKEIIKNSRDIIDILTKKTKKGIVLAKPEEVEKKKQILSVKITRISKKSEELDIRKELIYNDVNNFLYTGEGDNLEIYSKETEKELIKKYIKKIDKFILAYSKFTVGEEDAIDTEKRVFEAILYGFTSPFLWKIRDIHIKNKGRDTALSDIPPFLVIAGQAWTGKTHLLEFISRLLGAHGRYFHYGMMLKPGNIRDYFYSENIFPLLIDEITKDYFTSTASSSTKGESFIKDITNSLTGKHPCFIGTTNTEFNANMQVIRRIYYLQVNRQFDKSRKSETDDYFSDIITDLKDELFRDFSYRFAEKINNGDEIIKDGDFLFSAREIFKNYFKISGFKIPDYFIEKPLFDYYKRGSFMWKNLFLTKREGFIFQDDVIVVNPKIVFEGDRFEREKAKKFLDIGIIIEDSVVLILNKEKFLDFIGIQSDTIFSKIKKIFRR